VVSIGNLTAGGTGKTPAVIMLARWAKDQGYEVAVLSRGYGREGRSAVLAVSDGSRVLSGPRESGDEPYLMATELIGVPVIVSSSRYQAGRLAKEKFGKDFLILDDGFQHLELERDLDVVLVDGENGFGNGHLLPLGPLREPVEQLRRADAFIVTRLGGSQGQNHVVDCLKQSFAQRPVFPADHVPEKVVFPQLNQVFGAEYLRGRRVAGFAGIAQPDSFKKTLKALGADLLYFRAFADHHLYTSDEIEAIYRKKESLEADFIITTQKDWVRMERSVFTRPDIGYLGIRFDLISGKSDFYKMVTDAMDKCSRPAADKGIPE